MKQFIKAWIKSKNPQTILGHKTVEGMFTYEYYDFLGYDGRFYSVNVVYDSTKIIGSLSSMSTVLIGNGEVQEVAVESFEETLNKLLVSFEDKETWLKNKSKVVFQEDWHKIIGTYIYQVINTVQEIKTDVFEVYKAELLSTFVPILVVSFMFNGSLQSPLKMNIGEHSLVKARDYSARSYEFQDFIEEIGEITGGVVWH